MDLLQRSLADMKNSNKVTDRRNAAIRLQDCFSDDGAEEICQTLDYNTINATGKHFDKLTWTRLYVEVCDHFTKEMERGQKGSQTNKNLYLSLVNTVFTKAARRDSFIPFLSWEKVYDFIAFHLQSDRFANIYGQSLVSMLERFLAVEAYRMAIDGPHWRDLLVLLIKNYQKHGIPTRSLLNCLKTCIMYGSSFDSVIPYLRSKIVNFYIRIIFEDSNICNFELLPYLQAVTALSRQNASEFRGILCKLGETIIPQILQVHSFSKEQEEALVDLLLVQYNLHLPCDVDITSDASYADDPVRWKEILRLMYAYCIDAVEEVATKRTARNRDQYYITENMMLLTAKCTKQISSPSLNEADNSEEEEGGHRKKKMRYKSFHVIISDVHKKPVTEGLLVWMSYISTVLRNFPELVGTKVNFANLVHLGKSLFNTNFMIRTEFYTYFMALINAEKFLLKQNTLNDTNDAWDQLWELTIRSITTSNDKEGAVKLMQLILKEVRPSNVELLLMLFVNNSMPRLKTSVQLLADYLALCSLPVKITNNSNFGSQTVTVDEEIAVVSDSRQALIRWLVNVAEGDILGFEALIATVLCSLVVKQSHAIIHEEIELYPTFKDRFTELEKMLLKSCFVQEERSQFKQEKRLISENNATQLHFIVQERPLGKLVDALQVDYDKLPKLNPERLGLELTQYKKLISKLNLYININNLMEKHSIGLHASGGKIGYRVTLENIFDKGMASCNEFIVGFFEAATTSSQRTHLIHELIKYTRLLFVNEHLLDKIRVHLNEKFSPSVIDAFRGAFRSNLARYTNCLNNNNNGVPTSKLIYEEDLPSKLRMIGYVNAAELELITRADTSYEEMSLEALHILMEYAMASNKNALGIFNALINDLKSENCSSYNQFLFLACEATISNLPKISQLPSFDTLLDAVNTLLQSCCRKFHKNSFCAAKIWNLFTKMISIIGPDNVNRQRLMILLGTMENFLKSSHNPFHVYEKAFEAFSELAKYDPRLEWSEFRPVGQSEIWVLDNLHNYFIVSGSQKVKLMAVDTICLIYQLAHPFDYSGGIASSSQDEFAQDGTKDPYQERRKNFLDQMFQKLLGTFDVAANLSSDETREEAVNCARVALSCLTRLIFANPYTQKQIIIFLFMMIKLKQIDMNLAKRALLYASTSATKTMCCYFPYVLKKILKLKYTIGDLPHQLFSCDTPNSFYNQFRNEICVEYFEQDLMPELDVFAKKFNVTMPDLIKQCYGHIMARLTPGLAAYSFRQQPRGLNLTLCNDVHKRLITTLGGKDVTDTLMATCLGDVVLNLISLTFDPLVVNTWNCPEIKLAEPVPPHYPEAIVESCLEFLKAASPHTNLSVIGYLANTSHESIYKILLTLTIRIHDSHDELEKFWRLHHFSFFVNNLLLKEPKTVFATMKEYVTTFVFNTYLRLLRSESEEQNRTSHLRFLRVVIHLISNLIQRISEDYPEEMKVFFNPVIRGLVHACNKYPELIDPSKTILNFLLVSKGSIFATCIESLDSFPVNIPEFGEYREIQLDKRYGNRRNEWHLSKEFERLLEDANDAPLTGPCWSKERLQFLLDLLSKRKKDLDRMVRNLESRRFSEECAKDTLHNIIQVLIGVVLNANRVRDEDVVTEAFRCLGEIGPVDLSVLVLPPYKSHSKITVDEDALVEIVKILSGYMTSEDIRLVTASGKVLRALFEFEACNKILSETLLGGRLPKVLRPFLPLTEQLKNALDKVDANSLEMKLGLNEMNEGIDYKSWLTQLTTGIIECFKVDTSLATFFLPLCHIRVDFCENVFPYVILLCLRGGKSNPLVKRVMSGYFRNFFTKFVSNLISGTESARSFTPSSFGTQSSIIYMNKLALRSLIQVVQFLRRHPLPQEIKGNVKLTPWDNNFWLDLNYLDVARAAQYCGANLTSILYIEIAATEMDTKGNSSHYGEESGEEDSQELYSQGNSMYPKNRSEASKIEKLLLKAYSSIGEADAAYGCGSARFADVQSSIYHMEQTMDWHRLLMLANGSSVDMDSCSDSHVALSLKQLGLYNVLWSFLKGVQTAGNSVLPDDLVQVQYECGWRLTKWDLNTDRPTYLKDFQGTPPAFQTCVYNSIQTGLTKETQNHVLAIQDGYRSINNELRHATLESSDNLYGFLSRIQTLRVVEDFFESENNLNKDVETIRHKWNLQNRIPAGGFKYQEPVLFIRNVLLRAYDAHNARVNLEAEINQSLLDLISRSRDAGRLDFAESCTTAMGTARPSTLREFEIAKNNWARGKGDVARHIMNKLIKKSNLEEDLYPAMLLIYGEWLSISHCERPAVILEKYLQRSCNIYEKRLLRVQEASRPTLQEISNAYVVLAKYADAQYQNVTRYMNSDVFQTKKDQLRRAREEENQMAIVDNESKRSQLIMKRNSSFDMEEIYYIEKERSKFLVQALRHYLRGLKTSNEHDLLIFRAISLWLENGNETNEQLIEETTRIFADEIMPSYKYIVVLHQLSARLSDKTSRKNDLLKEILLKCTEEHPYHGLPVLLTQANLHQDEMPMPSRNSTQKVQLTGRVRAAGLLVDSLRKSGPLKTLVSRMETLWLALIRLANISDRGNVDGVQKSIDGEIMKILKNLEVVAVPTSTIPVLPTGNYKDTMIGIKEFDKSYSLVGGINSPKKIKCRGTNGFIYNMLLKGQDDLRQDAVMQQVFSVMNRLLEVETKTRTRRLHIRTYKVIPLSQRTGLIEWVENTQTLGEYLVGIPKKDEGAHVRYRPTDLKPIDCRQKLMAVKNNPEADKKFSTYMTICEHFKPVFRHFFFENFKEAGVFFEKRLAYTRSVATTSIVGYILGLGDRHVMNILIDNNTAEFIHIDLGVAFEQGRILPTPETVPFRLTRDVIDGMGISGVEGVFRKSSEMTMEVLRNNTEIIITVLQVLLYDPLYMWTLTHDRVAKVQPSDIRGGNRKSKGNPVEQPLVDSMKERNNSASRVLLRLRQKLMGIEEEGGQTGAISSGSSLSVDGHVSLLVQRAMDPHKLCRLFPGWQAYL